jgi:hypothetical protein
MQRTPIAGLLFVALLLSPCLVLARVDGMQLRLLEQYRQSLRWDNIENRPYWVNGVQPELDDDWTMHRVHLEPGRHVTVRVPPHESLRVYHESRALTEADLDIALSDGSGLSVTLQPQLSEDGRSLLVSPGSSRPLLARILRPVSQNDGLDVALFNSRRTVLADIAPYRRVVPLPGNNVWLHRMDRLTLQRHEFTRIDAGNPLQIEIKGPGRLLFEIRLLYRPGDSKVNQDYRLLVALDDEDERSVEFITEAETAYAVSANGTVEVVGRVQRGYLDLPGGRHSLRLGADRTLYLRLLEQEENDYLIPRLNQPELTVRKVREHDLPADTFRSVWRLPAESLERAGSHSPLDVTQYQALRIARDNAFREGGLSGAYLLRQAALARSDYPPGLTAFDRLKGSRTFYRDLLPAVKNDAGDQRFQWFLQQRLWAVDERKYRPVIAEQHVADWLNRLGGGYFVAVPAGVDRANRYLLPHRSSPGQLRLVVDRRSTPPDAAFMLQMGDETPSRVRLLPEGELPRKLDRFQPVQAALTVLQNRFGINDNTSLSGAFGAFREPAELVPAAIYELPLARDVDSIKVWRPAGSHAPVSLALHYRTSKPFRLSGASYLAFLENRDADDGFHAFLRALHSPDAMPSVRQQSLRNDWLPLIRLLRSKSSLFASTVVSSASLPRAGNVTGKALDALIARAREEQNKKQWLPALERWGMVVNRSDGRQRQEAQYAQAMALQQLGETYLAERLLRYLVLSAADSVRRRAADVLADIYHQTDDRDSRLALQAAMFVHHPSHETLISLSEALMDAGQYDFALQSALLVPNSERVDRVLLRATYNRNWLRLFRHLLENASDKEWAFWLGMNDQRLGMFDSAQEQWRKAGERGWAWSDALRKGMQIRAGLQENGTSTEAVGALIEEWEVWQKQHPGPLLWREAADSVRDYAGSDTYYSIERDLYAQAFRGTAKRPVKLTVTGPVRLRLEVRPLHRKGAEEAADGWLTIERAQALTVYPITDNRASEGLRLAGNDQWQPGRLIDVDVDLGPGMHDMSVSAGAIPISVRVFERRPENPLSVLPGLAPHALAAAMEHNASSSDATERTFRLIEAANNGTTLSTEHFRPQDTGIDVKSSRRLLSGRGASPALIARLLAADDADRILALPPVENEQNALSRMLALLWVAEKDPERYSAALVQAERLIRHYPSLVELQPIWNRLKRHSRWSQLSNIYNSAGMRSIEGQGWQPDNIALRIRKALLQPFPADEEVLSGSDRLVLAMLNRSPTRLQLSLRLETLYFLPRQPVELVYQVDGKESRTMSIMPDHPEQMVQIPIPAGEHQLRLFLRQPVINHFLRLRFQEDNHPVIVRWERAYQLATSEQPLQFYMLGPGWLRIDEWRDGETFSRFQDVADGWQLVTLNPSEGRKESLLRVNQRRYGPEEPQGGAAQVVKRTLEPVPGPVVRLPDIPPANRVHFEDAFPLGRQQDGSWSLGVSLVRRNNLQEDISPNLPEQFTEFFVTHRYFNEPRHTYFESGALGRIREYGGPTVGFNEMVEYRPDWTSLNFRLQGSLFFQVPEDKQEWSGLLRLAAFQRYDLSPKTSLHPYLSVFGRYLSLRDDLRVRVDDNFKRKVDQDIFTPYKADHRSGVVAALGLRHRPWLDTRWSVRGSVVSNENMNVFVPDHFGVRVDWDQLLGPVAASLNYLATFYLEDGDRTRRIIRDRVNLGLSWNYWLANQNRLELALDYTYDIDRKNNLGFLAFTWHFSDGRGYRDFRPGAFPFRNIRRRQVPQDRNNVVSDVRTD